MQAQDNIAITMKTNRYNTYGAENMVQFSLLASPAAEAVDVQVDFGFGKQEYTISSEGTILEDDSLGTFVGGTTISGRVSKSGVVKVYCDHPELLDYFDCHYSEITELDITKLTGLGTLSVAHNEIKKLDLSTLGVVEYLDLKDNPYNEGLILPTPNVEMNGRMVHRLKYLNINQIGDFALPGGTVDTSVFPALYFFTAWDAHCLKSVDVTTNDRLIQLSLDNTGIKSIDVSNNPNLLILNVSDCGINKLDVTHNPKLVELYIANEGANAPSSKLTELDVTKNPHLQRLFCGGNRLTTLDLRQCKNMVSVYASNNRLTHIDIEGIDSLAYLEVAGNCFDFATLPEVDPMTYFDYDLQRPISLEREYAVGQPIDMSSRILREGTMTDVTAYSVNKDGVSHPVELTYLVDYDYDDGVVTFLKEQSDSVFFYFKNDTYTGVRLESTKFIVNSESDYGKPIPLFDVTADWGETVDMTIKTAKANDVVYVDFGDGIQNEVTADNGKITIEGPSKGKVSISGKIGTDITAITIGRDATTGAAKQVNIKGMNLTELRSLNKLVVENTLIEDIDLSWNNSLTDIQLNNNKLKTLNLTGVNDLFHKNCLTTVSAKNNELEKFEVLVPEPIQVLKLDNNKLTTFSTGHMYAMRELSLSNNEIAEIDLTECTELKTLDISNNKLASIVVNKGMTYKTLDLRNNNMLYSTLPATDAAENCLYAPQRQIAISEQLPMCDLSTEAYIHGKQTTYKWYDAETGAALTSDDCTVSRTGMTTFKDNAVGKKVYCVLTNGYYTDFSDDNALRTTVATVTNKPAYKCATFTTPIGGENVELILRATKPNTHIYIDWGNGQLTEYSIGNSKAQTFTGATIGNSTVTVYSSTCEGGNIDVFSIGGVTMNDIDVSKMSDLYCLTVISAGLKSIDVTNNAKLAELTLSFNELKDIDLSKNKELYYVLLNCNQFKSVDFSNNPKVQWLALADNGLTEVNLGNMPSLFDLHLDNNALTELDLTGMPQLGQLWLGNNKLKTLNLENCKNLTVLDISKNYFDYSTLPYPNFNVYYYGDQAPIEVPTDEEGALDLSSQYMVYGSPSEYYFFEGALNYFYDEEGNVDFDNKEFTANVDFVSKEGHIKFVEDQTAVTGYIYNETFPEVLLFTKTVPAKGFGSGIIDGIEDVKVNTADNAKKFNLLGQRVTTAVRGIKLMEGKKYLTK